MCVYVYEIIHRIQLTIVNIKVIFFIPRIADEKLTLGKGLINLPTEDEHFLGEVSKIYYSVRRR